jgi:hypothetical protein
MNDMKVLSQYSCQMAKCNNDRISPHRPDMILVLNEYTNLFDSLFSQLLSSMDLLQLKFSRHFLFPISLFILHDLNETVAANFNTFKIWDGSWERMVVKTDSLQVPFP